MVQVAALPGDRFVIPVSIPADVGSSQQAAFQIFDASGAPLTGVIEVETDPTRIGSGGILYDGPGNEFVIAWSNGTVNETRAARFDSDGVRIGDSFVVDSYHPDLPEPNSGPRPPLGGTLASDGSFHAAWHYVLNPRGSESQVFYGTYDRDGARIAGPERLDSDARPLGPPMMLPLPDGRAALVYLAVNNGAPFIEFRDRDGAVVGTAAPIPTGEQIADATVLADGSLVVISSRPAFDPTLGEYRVLTAYRLAPDGTILGTPQTVTDDVDFTGLVEVAALQNGGFVVLWHNGTIVPFQPPVDLSVQYQVFDRDGAPVGGEQTFLDRQAELGLAVLDDGRIVVPQGLMGEEGYAFPILDLAASHTPAAGGDTRVISTFAEQDAIGRGDGVDTLVSDASLALKPFIPNLTLTGSADLNADGNAMANLMTGNGGANILVGYEGNDILTGEGGDDFLAAGRGADSLVGGEGDDIVWGGQSDDSVLGGAGADTLNGDRDQDTIDGGDSDDFVNGGSHADSIGGGAGADTVTGGQGDDSLAGGEGADTLVGDRDDDLLAGGEGADRFLFADGSGADTIANLDFDLAGGDRIAIRLDGGAINGVAIGSIDDLWDRVTDTLQGVTVDLGDGSSVVLAGLNRSGLSADMFELVV